MPEWKTEDAIDNHNDLNSQDTQTKKSLNVGQVLNQKLYVVIKLSKLMVAYTV